MFVEELPPNDEIDEMRIEIDGKNGDLSVTVCCSLDGNYY